ncbi:HNH endonuclease [Streptomyces sp. NBC_00385]|uniref:HNH endonuclease n=1 Tax=Streptomyces sp. NBC_00385 TaxID=2975733 RepID=UPI002DDAB091|nr:HNH endonuclease signature motif containing protein [Streptomyces sp. NBC_00385]WRZ07883.1 HNH endonuclease [Streptomyces sp. NBC_00385]
MPTQPRKPWAGSSRRESLPRGWERLRRRVIRRDGGVCTALYSDGRRCELPGTDVDHVIPHSLGGSDLLENLQLLCPFHHRAKSSSEGGTAAALTRKSVHRKPSTHPALDD